MAKFNSTVYSEIRGSVNGLTYSRNGNSAYVRSKATPVNPRTDAQTTARESLGYIASQWRALTEGQRNAWNALATTVPYTNSLGNVSYYSGFQLFVRNNANVFGAGQGTGTLITDAVASPAFPNLTLGTLAIDASSGSVDLAKTLTPSPATGFNLVIEATAPFSAGRKFVAKNQYSFVEGEGDPETGTSNLGASYVAKFGAITDKAGMKVSVRARFVDFVSGFASPYVEIATTIVA